MTRVVRTQFMWVFAPLAVAVAVGCGGSDQGGGSGETGPSTKDSLSDLANLLKEAQTLGKKPPTRPAEMAEYEASAPAATAALARGEIAYAWGSGLTGGTAVVAHDAGAESAGGWVLLQDGTVKQMSADEFRSAAKAAGFKAAGGKK